MTKALLIVGGVLNSVFFLFHVYLGYQIHHLVRLAASYRSLMEALNVGGCLFILFFAYASLCRAGDLIRTRLGWAVLALVSALYLSRAAEEFFLFSFTPAIFGSCALVGGLYAAILVLAVRSGSRSSAAA